MLYISNGLCCAWLVSLSGLADPELEKWRNRMAAERDAILATPYPTGRFHGRGLVLSAGGRYDPWCLSL